MGRASHLDDRDPRFGIQQRKMTQLSPFLSHLFTTLAHRPYVLYLSHRLPPLRLSPARTCPNPSILNSRLGHRLRLRKSPPFETDFLTGIINMCVNNLKGRVAPLGVPLWDSLSYTFLAFASFSTATLVFFPYRATGRSPLQKQILFSRSEPHGRSSSPRLPPHDGHRRDHRSPHRPGRPVVSRKDLLLSQRRDLLRCPPQQFLGLGPRGLRDYFCLSRDR